MVEFINTYMTEADLANIARISTGKKKRSDKELLRLLIERGHYSVFEHAVMTFYVKVPIYTARQWMRHRIASYTEKSGRYSEMEEYDVNVRFNAEDMADRATEMFEYYDELIKGGVKKEDARQILPLCTFTEFYWTVNLRSLMNFLKLRMDKHAQADIRENAYVVYNLFRDSYPTIADAYKRSKNGND